MTDRIRLDVDGLRLDCGDTFWWLTIDRLERGNALTIPMYRAIKDVLETGAKQPRRVAIIVTGTGPVFVSGGDMSAAFDGGMRPSEALPFAALRDSAVPVVAAVNGRCFASGVVLALLSDVSVAATNATFRLPELQRGFPEVWTAAVLPAHIGAGRANDLMTSAREIDADEAHRIGLVTRLVELAELRAAAEGAALELLEAAPAARRRWRQLVAERYGPIDETAMDAAMELDEVREGFAAFGERRPPAWSRRGAATLDTALAQGHNAK